MWKAVQAGAAGVLVREWGPAGVSSTLTGTEILNDDKYKAGTYEPDLLRRSDMSESPGWKELGEVAGELKPYQHLFAVTTLHGNHTVRTNNSAVKVRTLTGRKDPFKILAVVNTKVGDYDEEKLKIDPATGKLQNYDPAGTTTFQLIVEKDYGLIDVKSGTVLNGVSTGGKKKTKTYEITLEPGEGRLYFRGKFPVYLRLMAKYKIPRGRAAALSAK